MKPTMTSDNHELTEDDYEAILSDPPALFCPDPTGIKRGDKLMLWVKVGGDMQLSSVTVQDDPYQKGPKARYVKVFGYGIRGEVNVKKLLTYERGG